MVRLVKREGIATDEIARYEEYLVREKHASQNTVSSYLRDISQFADYLQARGPELLEVTADSYRRLFAAEPKVRAIHAGLECGLFLEKYPDLEMVSFGPTLRGVHSPDERLEIATVPKFWELLKEVLKKL